MENTIDIIGAVFVLLGSVFLFLGALGLVRMPDLFNRIQAGTKASTLGTMLTLLGIVILIPAWWGKLVLLIIFVLITNPVSSHVLARAAYCVRVPFYKKTLVDLYEKDAEDKYKDDLKNE